MPGCRRKDDLLLIARRRQRVVRAMMLPSAAKPKLPGSGTYEGSTVFMEAHSPNPLAVSKPGAL